MSKPHLHLVDGTTPRPRRFRAVSFLIGLAGGGIIGGGLTVLIEALLQ